MAVYTEVGDEDLAGFLARYACGAVRTFKGIAEGVENTNYLVVTERGRFILTLYEKRVAEADLPYFLALLSHLAARGVSCPVPVADRSGALLGTLCGRRAALVTFLDGVSLRRPRPEQCAAAGEALALLHRAGRDFALDRPNALGPAAWPPLAARIGPRADEVAPGLAALIAAELDAVATGWPTGLPQGVIHADLFPDNVFFLDGRLSGIIDFYFACTDALAYDLAVSLNAWCFDVGPDGCHVYDPVKGRALVAGYERVRPLDPAERTALPTLARGAALRFLLTRAIDWLHHPAGALVVPHDPRDYIDRLTFHRTVETVATYEGDATARGVA
jgi:homoserine kinase type II